MSNSFYYFEVTACHGRRGDVKVYDKFTIEVLESTESKAIIEAKKAVRSFFDRHVFSRLDTKLISVETIEEKVNRMSKEHKNQQS